MPSITTLVVDDSEEFRRFLRSMLQERTQCQVVGEVADGLEAVRRAEELRPELILLDLGLPTLNGFDAARRILQLSPNSKILFVSQNCAPEIARAALRMGALGYLLKSDATELPLAVETVLQGKQFVSSHFGTSLNGSVGQIRTIAT